MNFELTISWVLGIIIILGFLIPYIVKMQRTNAAAQKNLQESQKKGKAKPLMQHPIINKSLCIGCGICVASCPEGNVLDIINGKATIINGSHCLGHGKCADNCPIAGIEIGLGDISEREDIPQLNEYFETNIPGIYIVGELSGLALISNAVEHGIKAIDHINQHLNSRNTSILDVIIVGAGPAGLSAALRANELNLNYSLLDQDKPGGTILHYPRQKMTLIRPVSIPLIGELKKPEYSKEELLDIWQQAIIKYKIELHTHQKVTRVKSNGPVFEVHTNTGILKAKKVIMAIGRRGTPRKLNIRGEELGKVMYKLIDAESYKNKNILVVGGGDSAVEAVVGLAAQPGNQVTISYRRANFFRLKARNEQNINSLIKSKKIKTLFESQPVRIEKSSVIIKQNEFIQEIENDYMFIFAGGELPFKLMYDMGIEFGKKIESRFQA